DAFKMNVRGYGKRRTITGSQNISRAAWPRNSVCCAVWIIAWGWLRKANDTFRGKDNRCTYAIQVIEISLESGAGIGVPGTVNPRNIINAQWGLRCSAFRHQWIGGADHSLADEINPS